MDEIERISITKYNAICNLGDNIDKIYNEAISANINNFEITDSIIKGKQVRLGKINTSLTEFTVNMLSSVMKTEHRRTFPRR